MNLNEKDLWVAAFWPLTVATALWAGISIGDTSQVTAPPLIFPILLAIVLIAWLFRITFLAGGRYR